MPESRLNNNTAGGRDLDVEGKRAAALVSGGEYDVGGQPNGVDRAAIDNHGDCGRQDLHG